MRPDVDFALFRGGRVSLQITHELPLHAGPNRCNLARTSAGLKNELILVDLERASARFRVRATNLLTC